jgi:hypothetical protein
MKSRLSVSRDQSKNTGRFIAGERIYSIRNPQSEIPNKKNGGLNKMSPPKVALGKAEPI